MLWLKQGQVAERIVVTLAEKTVLDKPVYIFVFKHITTKELVTFEKSYSDDLSSYPKRYNEFEISTASLFLQPGQYIYKVYEKFSPYLLAEDGSYLLTEEGQIILAEGIGGVLTNIPKSKVYLLAEDGSYLLTEDGKKIIAEGTGDGFFSGYINEVENGKMNLLPSSLLNKKEYSTTTIIKTYQG